MDAFEKKGSVWCGKKEVFFRLEGEEGKGLLTVSLSDGVLRKQESGQTDGTEKYGNDSVTSKQTERGGGNRRKRVYIVL